MSCTYTYLLACARTKKCVLIDPCIELVERDLEAVNGLGLDLVYAFNTHVHADHITGTGVLKQRISGLKSVLGRQTNGAKADVFVSDGDIIEFGDLSLKVYSTP